MAHPARLERAACGFEVRRSIQLSYGRARLAPTQAAERETAGSMGKLALEVKSRTGSTILGS